MQCLGFCFIDITVVIGSYGIAVLNLFTTFALKIILNNNRYGRSEQQPCLYCCRFKKR